MNTGSIMNRLVMPIAVGGFIALFLLERRRPLRRTHESTGARTGRNLAVAGAAAAAVFLVERPIAGAAAKLAEARNLGLLNLLRLPRRLKLVAAVLLLDYTLYLWHVLTHRVAGLWRFHVVHHADLDLDTTTALRFHFGEMIISVIWRTAQIVVIGVSPDALRIWQALLLPSILFHHSNLRIPEELERHLSRIIVTPRLHGIHHSIVKKETNSNWSSGLTIWDRLHGTFRSISEHDGVEIGVPAYRVEGELTLGKLLEMPFIHQRPTWSLPAPEDVDGR